MRRWPIADNHGLFRDLDREHHPLSQGLIQLVLKPALADTTQLSADDLSGRTNSDIAGALLADRWHPPSLGEPWVGSHVPGQGHARPGASPESTRYVESRRFPLEWQVEGCAEWLDYWPDGADLHLGPVDRLDGEPDLTDQEWKRDWNRRVERADRRFVRDGPIIRGFVEIVRDDPRRPNEARDEEVDAEHALLSSYVAAVRQSAAHHRDGILEHLVTGVASRRATLAWEHELADGLQLRPAPSSLRLASAQTEGPAESHFALPPRRLDDPSFLNLLNAIRHWVGKVQQYPASFQKLGEDDLSNLLAVSLALAFGVAEREVFCVTGKSDVFVPTAALRELAGQQAGTPDEFAFIAEAKKGSGPTLASDAKTQLDGYIPARSRHAALIFYIEANDLAGAGGRILTSLRARTDYNSDEPFAGSPFPVLQFTHDKTGEPTSVAVIFVHLPLDHDPTDRAPESCTASGK
jgi:hypothetical protein